LVSDLARFRQRPNGFKSPHCCIVVSQRVDPTALLKYATGAIELIKISSRPHTFHISALVRT
jgi:hypothetical protein